MLAAAVILAAAGGRVFGGHLSGLSISKLTVMTGLAFVGLLAFGEVRGWNLLLLSCFSTFGGTVLYAILPMGEERWMHVAVWTVLCSCLGGLVGVVGVGRFVRWARPLWMSAWIYVLGWLLLNLGAIPESWAPMCGILGAVVLTGLVGVRVATWRSDRAKDISGPVEAGRLLLLSVNLFLALGVLAG